MREHLGEDFSGTVTAVTGFGIFVTLDAMFVEGLVHITELGGDYFRFDEARQELRGERSGIRYSIGARVRVQVSRVDLDGRKIDFRLVHEAATDHKSRNGKYAELKNASVSFPTITEDSPRSVAKKKMNKTQASKKSVGSAMGLKSDKSTKPSSLKKRKSHR
jgi:ribonuclease R